jgi:hypothetical protein
MATVTIGLLTLAPWSRQQLNLLFYHCTALGAKVYMTTELLLHLPWFLGITNMWIYLLITVLLETKESTAPVNVARLFSTPGR